MPNRSHPTTSDITSFFSAAYPLTNTPVRAACQVLALSDYGVEIGGPPGFEDLPRTVRQGSARRIERKRRAGLSAAEHRAQSGALSRIEEVTTW